MAKISVYNLQRQPVAELELRDDVFAVPVNEHLMYEMVKAQLASRRAGSANSKTRSEVAGSTRKVIKQKGTGGARHGSITAPIYVGGGKAHGPKPRSYAYRPPRKVRLGALRSALSLKLQEGKLMLIDELVLSEAKTKTLAKVLQTLQAHKGALLVDATSNVMLSRSSRNLPKVQHLPPAGLNVYDILRHDTLIVSRGVLEHVYQRCDSKASESNHSNSRETP